MRGVRAATLLLGALAAGRTAAMPVPLGPCGPIRRPHETLEIPVPRLQQLGGTPIERLGVLAFRGGSATPVPFQVDERRGRKIVLPSGPQPVLDDKPGVLDPDDLLVLMACDVGEHATAEQLTASLPADARLAAWRELRVHDPIDRTTGWFYVVVAELPPATDRHYVEYDPKSDLVRTATYEIGCSGALPTYFALSMGAPLGPNLLDGVRLRAEARLRGNLARWAITERDGRHKLLAWKVGPVRVVRQSQHYVDIGLGIHLSAGTAHTYFTAQHVFGPGSLHLPFSPSVFFADVSAFAGADLQDMRGWRYRAPGVPPAGFAVDGTPDQNERTFDEKGDWFILQQGTHAILVQTVLSDNLATVVPLRLVYRDDVAHAQPPERVPGTMPLAGFRGTGLQALQGGRYWFQLRVAGLLDYEPGDEQRTMRQATTPVAADVTARWPPAAAPAPPP